MTPVPLEQRFWAKVDKNGPVPPHVPDLGACWVWTACRFKRSGYGCIGVKPRLRSAHRVCWELVFGPIPFGMLVCHRCDNPACVRPEHLFLGTHTDNVRDMVAKGRRVDNAGELHPSAKLSNAQVAALCAEYATGATQRDLAARYGVTQPTVSKLVRGRRRGIYAEVRRGS